MDVFLIYLCKIANLLFNIAFGRLGAVLACVRPDVVHGLVADQRLHPGAVLVVVKSCYAAQQGQVHCVQPTRLKEKF